METTSVHWSTQHWPNWLSPAARTVPSVFSATVCSRPAQTWLWALGRATNWSRGSFLPHRSQNFAWSRRTSPQLGQIFSTLAPHMSQNRAPGRSSTPQALHLDIVIPPGGLVFMVSLYEMMQENTSLSVHRRRSLPLGGPKGADWPGPLSGSGGQCAKICEIPTENDGIFPRGLIIFRAGAIIILYCYTNETDRQQEPGTGTAASPQKRRPSPRLWA